MAGTGTLFLDEIGDIPLALQPKLLRLLQEKEFERLGSGKTHHVDVRLVAATHRNLSEMVARDQFRSDLYYRLNVFPVMVPPLRERREDIALLVSHFVEVFSRRIGKRINTIPKEILDLYLFGGLSVLEPDVTAYSWPGNVRELQNLIERAVIGSENGMLANPFPALNANSPDSNSVNIDPVALTSAQAGTFMEAQRAMILRALHASGWIVGGCRGAAARLGLKRTTLISKMKKLGISRPAWLTETTALNQIEHSCQSVVQ